MSASEDWLDWADAQADPSLRWAHMPFCWFCHEAALLYGFMEYYEINVKTKFHQNKAVQNYKLESEWHNIQDNSCL